MKRRNILTLAFCGLLLLTMTVPGVYALWQFAEDPAQSASETISLKLKEFDWEGSEILPDDEETGHAHAALIDNLINGEGIGLNTPDSYLNDQIDRRSGFPFYRDTLGSMAIREGDELNNLFDLDTQNVTFLIQMVSDNTYYIFTTSLELGENGSPNYPIGSTISPIYRTTVVKGNGVWTATITQEGAATSAYYEESQIINITRSKIPSFDPDSWRPSA